MQGKFDWIVKRTIGPIIDFIVDKTPLKSLLNDIQNKVQSAIGVDELKKKVSQALETALGDLKDPLAALKDKPEASIKALETVRRPYPSCDASGLILICRDESVQ